MKENTMDKNLRDRVEGIAFDCLEEEIAEMEWLKDGCHKIATALCSLIEEREDLAYANGWCASSDGKPLILKSQRKDQKGEKKYPCAKCGKLRTKAEGGTIFTVCDTCWEEK